MSSKTSKDKKTSKLKERTAKLKYQLELDRRAAADMVAAAAVRLTNLSQKLNRRQANYKTGGKKKRKTQKRRK